MRRSHHWNLLRVAMANQAAHQNMLLSLSTKIASEIGANNGPAMLQGTAKNCAGLWNQLTPELTPKVVGSRDAG